MGVGVGGLGGAPPWRQAAVCCSDMSVVPQLLLPVLDLPYVPVR